MAKIYFLVLLVVLSLLPMDFAAAHHVLGRPAYSLNEDSNTPPSIQGELEVGEFTVTFMVFPAFPKPGEPGRVNLYVKRLQGGAPYEGKVSFAARVDSWLPFAGKSKKLGVQPQDDSIFRQGFKFHNAGDYIITARFEDNGEPYVIDIPLRVGAPPGIGPIGVLVAILLVILVTVGLVQRRRVMTGRIRSAREQSVEK